MPAREPLKPTDAWWAEAPPEGEGGLTQAEAASRLREWGPNLIRARRESVWVLEYLSHFRNPLVLVLLAASAVSAVAGELANFLIIATIVVLSVTLDFVQEFRAGAAAEKLRQSVSLRVRVLRDGDERELPAAGLVPGDLVLLSAGDLVPADGWLLEARDFFVNQALLTGEPYPVEKRPAWRDPAAGDLVGAANAVFMGSSVISGSARMRVARTGTRTAVGEIADSVLRPSPPNSFEIGTRRFGLMILRLTLLMVMFVLFVNIVWHRQPWVESFLFAVALAVGLTPELLPMVVSVTLARGALRMAARQVIVKRQSSIQDLGSMDVLCTDKTGTLTEAKIRLEAHVDPLGRGSDWVLQLAVLNSHFESGIKSPLDDAILAHRSLDLTGWTKVDEVPFDFERRRVSVLLEHARQRCLVVKGAPDDMLALCSHIAGAGPDDVQPLDAAALARATATCHELEDAGLRVLGIGWRRVAADHGHAAVDDESQLVLVGFAAFLDPPKESAGATLRALQAAGVAIKIVTGDSARVTRHVCGKLSLPVEGVLTGSEIAAMDDAALRARVGKANLFCRVNPTQKNRVIQALKARGHVVGYLGDGINDAPSLHSADVGLSVDSAVDVAKEAADMILLRHDLDVLHDAVLEGRRTFGNIMKYIMMGTSSNFGNMFSMAGAALFLPFLPMLPTQILLNNVLYDLSELTIPFDDVDEKETRRPRVMDISLIRDFMLTVGPISSLFDFMTFGVMLLIFRSDEALFQTGWFVESLCTQVLVIFVIRTRGRFWRSRPHPWLIASSLAVVGTALAFPYTPLAGYFGFVAPPPAFYAALVLMTAAYLGLVEAIKRWFFRRHPRAR